LDFRQLPRMHPRYRIYNIPRPSWFKQSLQKTASRTALDRQPIEHDQCEGPRLQIPWGGTSSWHALCAVRHNYGYTWTPVTTSADFALILCLHMSTWPWCWRLAALHCSLAIDLEWRLIPKGL